MWGGCQGMTVGGVCVGACVLISKPLEQFHSNLKTKFEHPPLMTKKAFFVTWKAYPYSKLMMAKPIKTELLTFVYEI